MTFASRVLFASATILASAIASQALAHITVQPPESRAGGYQVLRFGVGHGCAGKATTAVTIQIPASVASAHPQPKPGLTLAAEHPKDAPDRVSAITWRGNLAADEFDEFLIHVRLPADAGRLAFPALQTCGGETVRWTGETSAAPAPVVVLQPAP